MIDRKKVRTAFRLMRKRGLYAQQAFTCCNECGVRACWENAAEADVGWAFYDVQNDQVTRQGEDLFISYGTFQCQCHQDPHEISRIGGLVCQCLKLAGLEYEWDGDFEEKIVVLNTTGKPQLAPRPRLTLVSSTSGDAQKGGDPPEQRVVRPQLRLVTNRSAAIQPTHGSETEYRTEPSFSDQPGDAIGATHHTEE
jgi:hypothetical protein